MWYPTDPPGGAGKDTLEANMTADRLCRADNLAPPLMNV